MKPKNLFNEIEYRMEDEGVDYCFDGYSDWSEIDDPVFHQMRLNYLTAKAALVAYVKSKTDDEGW